MGCLPNQLPLITFNISDIIVELPVFLSCDHCDHHYQVMGLDRKTILLHVIETTACCQLLCWP